jgi:hypothetical protein
MKLSRTGWNNVIIFSVMSIILIINATNNKLFPDKEKANSTEQLILPEHSAILTLLIQLPNQQQVLFERIGRGWQLTTKGIVLQKTDQQIEQLMFAWQQSFGLVQATEMIIDSQQGIQLQIGLTGELEPRALTLYVLSDQLLIYLHQEKRWLALPATLAQQLLPFNL